MKKEIFILKESIFFGTNDNLVTKTKLIAYSLGDFEGLTDFNLIVSEMAAKYLGRQVKFRYDYLKTIVIYKANPYG